MTAARAQQLRLQLSEQEARALHAGLLEALAANVLAPAYAEAARCALDRLASKVPSWLDRAPIGGEAGYLIAAHAVLRCLVDAEERGRSALTGLEVVQGLGNAKPVGVTITDVLARMRRERLIRRQAWTGAEGEWWSAAPAGRQLLAARDGSAQADDWRVHTPAELAELIYREYQPGRDAYRPCVQAIGRLGDEDFERHAAALRAAGLLAPAGDDSRRLLLTDLGARLAEERLRATLPPHTFLWGLPSPPLPYRRGLPVRTDHDDRHCSCGTGHAAWLVPSSKTKLRQKLLRDGTAEWDCRWCGRHWLIYLQPHFSDGKPAYIEPARGVFARPAWRPR